MIFNVKKPAFELVFAQIILVHCHTIRKRICVLGAVPLTIEFKVVGSERGCGRLVLGIVLTGFH